MYRFITLSIVLLLLSHTSINSQEVQISLHNEISDFSEVNIGFNRRSDPGNLYTNESFKNLLTDINPDIVRYPGGTQANYWDWQTGQFIPATDKDWNNKEVVTIPTFINALPERTKVIYVVNMARPTPSTGINVNSSQEILKSEETLHLMISDMISAIDKFVDEGKKPFAIELGNEFYFGNEESGVFHIVENNGIFYSGWDKLNGKPFESSSKKEATEIIALDYLQRSTKVVEQLKTVYPEMKFALTTTKSGNGNSFRDRWNNTIFDNLKTNPEFATLKNDIVAVTQHHYLNTNYGAQTVISDISSSKAAIAEGIQYPIDKQNDYDLVPEDYKIWYTEYGEVKGIAEETWSDAVRYAALNYSWLSRGEKVQQLDFHHLTDNTVINQENSISLAPVGIAAMLFLKASSEMTEIQQLNFNNNPISINGVKSLYGLKFKNQEKETLLILNLSDNEFENVNIDNLFSYTGTPKKTQYYSNLPWISGISLGNDNISINTENINNSFIAKNFSITLIEAKNETLNTSTASKVELNVYPNPTENIIHIKSSSQVTDVSILSLEGKLIKSDLKMTNNTLEINSLQQGIYFLKIKTKEGIVIKKIVKS